MKGFGRGSVKAVFKAVLRLYLLGSIDERLW
jgi:hypothetical protein